MELTEARRDFLKLKEVLRRIPSGDFTPAQLGKLFQQYHDKHLIGFKNVEIAVPVLDNLVDLDGDLPMFARLDK